MEKKNNFLVLVLLIFFSVTGCKNTPIECKDAHVEIENRWNDRNGGMDYLEVKNKKDVAFLCSRINNFPEGKDVRIAYSYGDIDIYLNNKKVQAIFTYESGTVYRVGIGKYVHDEALTKRIMKIMKITKRCWGEGCK